MRYSLFFPLFSGDEGANRTTDLALLHNLTPCLRRQCRECRLKTVRNKSCSILWLINSISTTNAPISSPIYLSPMPYTHRNQQCPGTLNDHADVWIPGTRYMFILLPSCDDFCLVSCFMCPGCGEYSGIVRGQYTIIPSRMGYQQQIIDTE